MTLRTRLVAILAALIALGLLVSGIVTYGALRTFLYGRVDDQLRPTQSIAVRVLIESVEDDFGPGPAGPPGLPIAAYAEARDASGNVIASESFGYSEESSAYVPRLPAQIEVIDEPFTVAAREDASYLFRALAGRTLNGGILIVALPLADAQDTLRRLVLIELVVAALLMAAIGVLARFVIRKELRPLDEMAGTATEIAGGDMSRRVDEGDPRTEVGRLGRALNRMLEEIEQAFHARKASEERMRRFLGDASHELRTPLTSIRGYAELFRRGAAERPADLELSMRRIEEESARMGILVDELLLLASADRMRPLETGPVDLRGVLEDLAQDARAAEPGRPVEVDAESPVVVTGDEPRLRQAVANLVRNALVHTPEGAKVELSLRARDGWAVVSVQDWGGGLSEDVLAHAFERFWRRDQSRARETGGTGLGLAIVDAIVTGHGGRVGAENVPGAGARFTIHLPIDADRRTQAQPT
ncbi:MAG TPA: ATP-binding protein [Actinomycetota bacterium]|nr:ATP-binding protein [Actinomycetota bacterium]